MILTAILTAGCAKEDENLKLNDGNSSAIELSSVSTDPMTKAVITGTEFTTAEAAAGIGLFLLDGSGNAYGSNPANVRYGYSDGKWTAASPLRIGNTEGTLVGYYPYSETATNVKAIPVLSSVNGTDWLYATPVEVTTANAKSISLSLSHALARISLSFRLDESYVGDGSLSEISLSGDCVTASGTLDATDGSITATASKFTAGTELTLSKSAATTLECLVVPVSNESNTHELKIACTIGGKAYSMTFTGDIAALTQGKQTDINLTVKNTSVTVDGSSIGAWGEGGTQTVTVGGDYKVTVKLHNGTPSSDVLVGANLDESGNAVVIKSFSEIGRKVICILDDGNTVEPIVDGNYYKFTISDVTKDITATVRYESYKLKAFVYPSYSGTIISEYETEHQPGDNITLEVTSSGKLGKGGKFVGWKDKDGNLISEQTSINFDIESDAFPVAVFDVNYGSDAPLGGVFTVAADKGDGKPKKVRFSKGNLYCSGASFDENGKCTSVSDDQWFLEQHQYDRGGDWDGSNGISHFMWSENSMRSLDKTYDVTGASDQDVFFTNSTNFAVNGVSAWHTLSQPEWAYLLGDSTERRGKHRTGVTVNGVMGLVIAPDKFSGTIGYTYDATDWATAEINDGLVFLPAAGVRYGIVGIPYIDGAGSYGYYWSSTHLDNDSAYNLDFGSGSVSPANQILRDYAYSVRLVTEYN